jgi:hypothetical protein
MRLGGRFVAIAGALLSARSFAIGIFRLRRIVKRPRITPFRAVGDGGAREGSRRASGARIVQ